MLAILDDFHNFGIRVQGLRFRVSMFRDSVDKVYC